jgi:hypothetical protein
LAATLKNQRSKHEGIKGILKSGNAGYHSVRNFLSSSVLRKQILKHLGTFFLYGCETWSLILREENRLGHVRENSAMKLFWPKREEVTGGRD